MSTKTPNRESCSATDQSTDLTRFQLETLRVVGLLMPRVETPGPRGLEIMRELETRYAGDVGNGRLYPNLDTLAEKGLVEKGAIDRRANWYALTSTGIDVLVSLSQGIAHDLTELGIADVQQEGEGE